MGTFFILSIMYFMVVECRHYVYEHRNWGLLNHDKCGIRVRKQPSGYDAGLTNQTSLVRFPSPLNFS